MPRMSCADTASWAYFRVTTRRQAFACVLCLCVFVGTVTACAHAPTEGVMARYDEPGGRFSILLPTDWVVDPSSSQYQFYAVRASRESLASPYAWVGLTWMPPPCDRTMVDDPVAWYADLLCWRDESVEISRDEVEVDGCPGLLIDCVSTSTEGLESRQITLVLEKYGAVWQTTCGAVDASDYPAFEEIFRTMLQSLEIRGAWSTAQAGEAR
jgi:hypothetical protein